MWCNQIGTVFLRIFLSFQVIEENAFLKYDSTQQQKLIKLDLSVNMLVKYCKEIFCKQPLHYCKYGWRIHVDCHYSVKQSDRNSSKTDTFHEPTANKSNVKTSSEELKTFARHKYGQAGVFKIEMWSIVQKLEPLKKCQFSNCSDLIASQCTSKSTPLSSLF